MNITIENKKAKAIEFMKKLDIYKPYIKGFEQDNTVCFYENFGGFWAWQELELMAKIKEFEEKHNCLVYAVMATLKRVYRDDKNKRFRLHPENDNMKDFYVENIDVIGIAVKVIKDVI